MPSLVLMAPAFLALLLLAVIVALLHQNYQRRIVPFPSLILWRRLQTLRQQAMPGRRLPRLNLPMLLQIAALALIALALARPLIGISPATPVHKIYVLDASGSMRAAFGNATRFDAATAQLADLMRKDIDPDGPRVTLLLAGSTPDLLFARQRDDHDLLAAATASLRQQDGATNWSAVERLVESVRKPGENDQLIVLTDGADAETAELGKDLPNLTPTLFRFGSPVPNAGLEAHLAPSAHGPDKLRLTGKVHFSGGGQHAALAVSFQSANLATPLELADTTIEAPPAPEVVDGNFDLDDLAIVGGGILSVRLSDDAQPADNVANFVIDAAPAPLNILVIGPAQPALLRALQSLPGAVVRPVDALPADLSDTALVVVDDVALARPPEANTLWIGHARIEGADDPPAVEPGQVTYWRNDHPLSRGIVWSSLALTRAVRFTPWPDADTLLTAGDTPLIEARSDANGRQVRIAFDPTREWARQTAFPQFLGNLVDWLGINHESRIRPVCTVGSPCPIDARWTSDSLSLVADPLSPTPLATIALPPPGGAFVPPLAGLYRHTEGENSTLLAVNPDPREELSLTPNPRTAGSAAPSNGILSLWPWLLACALLVLCLEAFISWRRKASPGWFLPVRLVVLALVAAAFFNLPGPRLTPTGETVLVAAAPLPGSPSASGPVDETARPATIIVGDTTGIGGDFGDPSPPPAVADTPWGSTSEALRIATAMLPPDAGGHIVLASNSPLSAEEIAGLMPGLLNRGIKVDAKTSATMPPATMPPGEIAVASVEGPPAVFTGDSFQLTGRIRSGSDVSAQFKVSENGTAVAQQTIALTAGDNPVDITIPKARQGNALYEMSVASFSDPIAQNNANGAWIQAPRPPHILILSSDATAGQDFADGLSQQGLTTHVLVPTAAPWLLKDWLSYDGYILADVPAISLNPTQQQLLADAVSQHGRPLLLMGGPHSFGPGGYLQTPLDRLSPLSSRVPKPAPQSAVVFVLDRSGSMAQMVGDVDRLEIAKQATISAISLLNPESQVAIVAFDTQPHLVLPLQPVSQIGNIEAALQQLGSGGGTDLYPALATALDQLRGADYPIKHIVALTDGLTPPHDYTSLLNDIKRSGASVSTIAIGAGSNLSILRTIADAGGGVFHASNDFRALPSILSQEAMMMSDSAVEERETTPQWVGPQPDFMSTLPAALPEISGYVLTTGKPDATIGMNIETADGGTSPLLGWWQYGSGTVVALTTEAYGPWVRNWLSMPGYDGLWSEVMRHFLSGADSPGLALHLTRSSNSVQITATALDESRQPRSGLSLAASIDPPERDKPPTRLPLHETHPGVYEATAPLSTAGDYRISVTDADQSADASFHLAFPARLAFDTGGGTAGLAALTGGSIIPAGDTFTVPPAGTRLAMQPNWIFWALCALAAFMLELFFRYGGGLFAGLPRRRNAAPSPRTSRPQSAQDRQPEYATEGS